jgi:spore coat polysaccharide biosynthesis protein SpsF
MKIGALIPIRLASERLPGKALKDICGRPAVHHLLDRVTACRYIADRKDVVVCTTIESSDDPLVDAVERYGCSHFRGSVDDIVRRLSDAMERFGFDAVVHAFGDNPLSATEYMDATMARLLADPSLDIVTVTGLPLGTATQSFTRSAMQKVVRAYGTERNDTGFMFFFTRTGLCRHEPIAATDPAHCRSSARLTMDYEADLALFRSIFAALYRPGQVFSLADAIAYLDTHPAIASSNLAVQAEYWQRTADKVKLQYRDAAGVARNIEFDANVR